MYKGEKREWQQLFCIKRDSIKLGTFEYNCEDFISEVISIDSDVADIVKQIPI